jgi:small nuclear ribonucleoprotein (snRNP)-like protein
MKQGEEETKLEDLTPSNFLNYLRRSVGVDVKITTVNGITYNGVLRSIDEHVNITLLCRDYRDVEFSASVNLVTESLVYIKGSEIESISIITRVYQSEK